MRNCAAERLLQGGRKSGAFSLQAWRGDDGARPVQSSPARPLAAEVWYRLPGHLHAARLRPFADQGGLIGAVSRLRSL
ncbi:hypothetical protein NS2R_05905 [Pseudomonas oryzihabitans]|nr:hypothetical protein NS2R_05905 [Pseudomonas psychrotolerans]